MVDWKTCLDKVKGFLKSGHLSAIRSKKKKPKNSDKQHKSDLEFLLKRTKKYYQQKKFQKAKKTVRSSIKKFPKKVKLLTIATDVYRASGDREKSLEYSELLITHHPDNWKGYGRAAQNLVALKRFKEAQEKIQAGLKRIPNQVKLFTIATDVYTVHLEIRENLLNILELLIHITIQTTGMDIPVQHKT